MLDGWVAIDDEDRLAQLSEWRQEWIIMPEDHLVIEITVNPALIASHSSPKRLGGALP